MTSPEWPFPLVVAHRGGGALAPENTLAALRCGVQHGFHAAEFDVMLAQDGVPVLMHDARRGRTIAGDGPVNALSARDLARLDAGCWFSAAFSGEPVPTLAQAIDLCRDNAIWMNIEIKPAPDTDALTGATVAQQVRHAQLPGDLLPLLSSFSVAALNAAKQSAPALPRGWLVDHIPANWQAQLVALDAMALHVNQRHLTQSQARAVKQAGYGLFCYTVNDPARAQLLLEWGVDGFCTDRIDVIGPDFAHRYLS